ncbi:MAG TPA: AAA family ATPase, partial [Solirubrobacteraceae bacterium]
MLLGRDAELGVVEAALAGLGDGRGGFLCFTGDSGLGKSALLGALAERAAERGWPTFGGRATEFERAMPFSVLVDALDDHLAQLEPARLARMGLECADELAAVFPSLAGGGGHFERYQLHRAVSDLLAALGAARPVVLLLDDLQWSDEATLETLAALVRRPPRGRVLLALAHRPSQALDDLAHQLDRQGFPRRTLEPLSGEHAAALIADRVPEPARKALVAQAAGNPFYLEQLARSPAAARQLPAAIAMSIQQQVEQLPAAAQRLLQGVAVAGEPADLRLASVAAGLDYDEALGVLDETLAAGLLREAPAGAAVSFRHPLVRRAVYERAGRGWRIGAHGRVRRALADLGADATLLAHHVEQSATLGDEEAIDLLVAAADRVAGRAPAAAAAWLAAALRLLPEEQGERRSALEEQRGAALL